MGARRRIGIVLKGVRRMRGCGFQVAKSIVQDRVSLYQRGFKNRHRNSEVWKRLGKFGFL